MYLSYRPSHLSRSCCFFTRVSLQTPIKGYCGMAGTMQHSRSEEFSWVSHFLQTIFRNFSTITALITDCLKQGEFGWTKFVAKAFREIKERMTEVLLWDFMKVFEITCDVSDIGICGVLSQEKHHVAYFSEKLNDTRQEYSTYDRGSMR